MKLHRNAVLVTLCTITAATLAACGSSDNSSTPTMPAQFKATTLVSDGSVAAANIDPNLKNGWGIAFNPTGVVWVSDNNTKKSTLYDGNGVVQSLVVTIAPNAAGQAAGPTGIVFNKSTDFQISANGGASANAVFLWATDAGTIAAWSPKVLPTQAVNAYDDGAGAAVYKGLAIGVNAGANLLYATDFHNKKVDVFDKSFNKIQLAGKFVDPQLPAGLSPFGIAAIGGTVYVSYALLGPDGHTQVNGAGNGVVDAFDTAGNLIKRIATAGTLNSPWGLVVAPANFGAASNDLLVGNFGDGTIDAFDPNSGKFLGALTSTSGSTFKQPGIWGMAFGNNVDNQPLNTLFFAAGPTPTTGVYGRLDVTP
ncbi:MULTISPECIES: TIGR03118 family protein [Paraburkholderia]|uniref:TIGR03118 family protein n=1 Tax=Paraburkholderia TaxID=1822464 RepID=UPI00225BC524|nr:MULTISPECIES: TIGR03118 family protein [Paraburkholderia]MCX4162447.1 TIGR03118 family protein [Paraburkholderia megapolitana]MDN7157942.1 TIGR03118 family protein [Paraburkholderia sp. CHISQ3]MDQ6494989.1 TIGR03118 family protein [Paraburkholderia megapolitana]